MNKIWWAGSKTVAGCIWPLGRSLPMPGKISQFF